MHISQTNILEILTDKTTAGIYIYYTEQENRYTCAGDGNAADDGNAAGDGNTADVCSASGDGSKVGNNIATDDGNTANDGNAAGDIYGQCVGPRVQREP